MMVEQEYRIPSRRFMLWWLGGSLFVYPLAIMIGSLGMMALAATLSLLRIPPPYETISPFFIPNPTIPFAVIALLGGVIGWSAGSIQSYLIEKYFFFSLDRWSLWSTLGGMAGGLLVGTKLISIPNATGDSLPVLLAMPVFVLIVSIFQWISLRHYVRWSGIWILANLVGGLIFSRLLISYQPAYFYEVFNTFLLYLLAPLAQGVVTGMALLWLFERHVVDIEEDEVMDDPNTWMV